ncbi:MAG: GMC family oxidoreductase, partial [Myxococcales bacterium]|nr:GMC family oxidoreductase [Myxococcales bacterium]
RARALAGAPPLHGWGNREVIPGPFGQGRAGTERFIRQNGMTTYHYAGTCRMGDRDDDPVTPRLAFRGIAGLTVADASVIPETPVSALNAPSMLIGLRAARFMREDATP